MRRWRAHGPAHGTSHHDHISFCETWSASRRATFRGKQADLRSCNTRTTTDLPNSSYNNDTAACSRSCSVGASVVLAEWSYLAFASEAVKICSSLHGSCGDPLGKAGAKQHNMHSRRRGYRYLCIERGRHNQTSKVRVPVTKECLNS